MKQLLTSAAEQFVSRRDAHGIFNARISAPELSSERPEIMILLGSMVCGAQFERPDMITLSVREAEECAFDPKTLTLSISAAADGETRGRLLFEAVSALYEAVLSAGRDGAFSRWDAIGACTAVFAEDPLATLAPELALLVPELFGEQFLMVSQELYLLMDELGELCAPDARMTARANAGRFLALIDELQADGRVCHATAYYPDSPREISIERRPFETVYLLGARRCDGRPLGIAAALGLMTLLPRLAFSGVNRAALTSPGDRPGMSCVTAGTFPLEWPARYVWCKAFERYAAGLFSFDNDISPVLPELLAANVPADAVRQYAASVFSVADIRFTLGGCLPVRQDDSALEAAARQELSAAEQLVFEHSLSGRFDSAYPVSYFASARAAALQKTGEQLKASVSSDDASTAFASMRALLEDDALSLVSAAALAESARLSKAADALEESIEEALRSEVFLQLDAPRSGFFARRDNRRAVDALRDHLIDNVYSRRLELLLLRQKSLLLRELSALLERFSADALAKCRELTAFAQEVSHISAGLEPSPVFDRELLDEYIAALLAQVQLPLRLPAGLHKKASAREMLQMLIESFDAPAAALFRLAARGGELAGFAAFCSEQGRDFYADAAKRLTARGDGELPVGCCYYTSTAELVTVDCILGSGSDELAVRLSCSMPRVITVTVPHAAPQYLRLTGGFHLADVIYYRRSI